MLCGVDTIFSNELVQAHILRQARSCCPFSRQSASSLHCYMESDTRLCCLLLVSHVCTCTHAFLVYALLSWYRVVVFGKCFTHHSASLVPFQVMVPGLEERGRLLFPNINDAEQIMPGYFNAPGALVAPFHYSMHPRNFALLPVTVVFCTIEK